LLSIAHITSDIDGRTNSGTARVSRELIIQLSNINYIHQTLIHYNDSDDLIYSLPNTTDLIIPTLPIPFGKKRSIRFIYFFIKRRFERKEKCFDVLHWHSNRILPLFFLPKAKKIIVTLHDAGQRIIPNVNNFSTRFFYWNAKLFQKKIHQIIAVSQNAKKELVNMGKFEESRISVIYNGTFFANIKPEPNHLKLEKNKFIVCVSRWQPHKNVEVLINAVINLQEFFRHNKMKVVLVGKPVNNYDLPFKLILKNNILDIIEILQDLSDNELAWLYENAIFNIAPSLHEGFGLSVLEGMSRGCPAIVDSNTATREILGPCGYHVDMRNSAELSKELQLRLQNLGELMPLRVASSKRAELFTWENAAKKLINIYRN